MPGSRRRPFCRLIARVCRRWNPAAWVAGLSFLLVATIALNSPQRYSSHLVIAVADSGVDARHDTRATLSPRESSDWSTNREMQRLTSDEVLDITALNGHMAVRILEQDLTVTQQSATNAILVSYSSIDPARTTSVLRHLTQAYLQAHKSASSRQAADRLRRGKAAFVSPQAAPEPSPDQPIPNITITEGPSPARPIGPSRTLILAYGLLVSALLGAASAFTLEYLANRAPDTSSVEQATGVPVLVTIPSHALAPSLPAVFPALYRAMQRPHTTFEGKLS